MIYSSTLHAVSSSREQEYLAGWQRARAELDNFRKQLLEEQGARQLSARREVVESLLLLADNFQALTQHMPENLQSDSWAQGVLHVARQFEQLLNEYGVTQLNPQGQIFDPQLHEAIEEVDGEESGLVMAVLQPGYVMGDIVLKPAKVRVAK